jgi:hypothetical protein
MIKNTPTAEMKNPFWWMAKHVHQNRQIELRKALKEKFAELRDRIFVDWPEIP